MGIKRQQTKQKQAKDRGKKDKTVKPNPRREEVKKTGKKKKPWQKWDKPEEKRHAGKPGDRQQDRKTSYRDRNKNENINIRYFVYMDGKGLPSVDNAVDAIRLAETLKEKCESRLMVVELVYSVGLKVIFEYRKHGVELTASEKEIDKSYMELKVIEDDVLKGKEIYIWCDEDFAPCQSDYKK